MGDWQKRAFITGDVVVFEYVSSKTAMSSSLVYVWDLDKTYLDTSFGNLKELWKTFREKALQKKNIPGTRVLVKALTASQPDGSAFPIYFITASPPQMEGKILPKLEFDEVRPYGIFCKDNLKNLKPKRLWRLTEHIGYKLQALLQLRKKLRNDVKQILWGDDSESDSIIYSLYSDICSGRVEDDELKKILEGLNVIPMQIDFILKLSQDIPEYDPVERVYINLVSDTDPDYYIKFGRRLVPTYNTFQCAMDLYQTDHIRSETLQNLVKDLLQNYSFSVDEIMWSINDFAQRRLMSKDALEVIMTLLQEDNLLPGKFRLSEKSLRILSSEEGLPEWIPDSIDYLNDYR